MAALVDVVADASPEAGLGHLSRAAAVAVALRCRGIETRCHGYGATEAFSRDDLDWSPLEEGDLPPLTGSVVVVDSYRLRSELLSTAAQTSRLVAMHDQGEPPQGAVLVVDVGGEGPDSSARRLAGPAYAALRPMFWGLPRREPRATVERVLVTTGSGHFGALGCELVEALVAALPTVQVSLVQGPEARGTPAAGIDVLTAPESLLGPLLQADLVVTAGGQTMLEAAATGAPCVALPLVENQRPQVATLSGAGAVHVVDPPSADEATRAARELVDDLGARRRLGAAGQAVVDGYGALRIAFEIERLGEGT